MVAEPLILATDKALIVIDKPAGMPSIAAGDSAVLTLADWIVARAPDQASVGKKGEAGLVHRLDNATSGLIVAARTSFAYEALRGQFDAGAVKKGYLALVLGVAPKHGEIALPIAHHPRKKDRMVVCDSKAREKEWKGRKASTVFEAIGRYTFASRQARGRTFYTLLAVEIATGVRHQIRVHLAHLGHPIAGDHLYQSARLRANDTLGLTRHFLHSHRLAFEHPIARCLMTFESPLPKELEMALARLAPL